MRAKQLNTDRLAWRWYANRSVLFLFLRHMYLPLWHFLHLQRLFPSKSTLFQNQRKGGAKMTVFRIKKQEITRLCPTIICGICRRHWKRRFFYPSYHPCWRIGTIPWKVLHVSARTALAASAAVSEIWRRMATLSTQGAKRAISKLLYNKARVTPFELRRRWLLSLRYLI